MADNPGRTLLVKAKVDLTSLKDSFDQIKRMTAALNKSVTVKSTAQSDIKAETKLALDSESRKQAAVRETIKAAAGRIAQEKSLRSEMVKTLDLWQHETIEVKKQVAALRERAALLHPQGGVLPTMARGASRISSTLTGTATQSAEMASYQQLMMRQMRLQASQGVGTTSSTMAASMLGMTQAPTSGAEQARLEEMRLRQLRLQQKVSTAAAPVTGFVSLSPEIRAASSATTAKQVIAAQREQAAKSGATMLALQDKSKQNALDIAAINKASNEARLFGDKAQLESLRNMLALRKA